MSESGSVLGVEDKPEPFTFQEIIYRFQIYIEKGRTGLKRFYNPDGPDMCLIDCATRGLAMTQKLVDCGCPLEVAADLTLLALWDLVVLIGTNCLHMFLCCVPVALYYTLTDPGCCSTMVALTHGIYR